MKVSVEVLQRVYASLQDQDDDGQVHKDGLNPDSHLFIIDAYEMPKWHWSTERGAFERYYQSQFFCGITLITDIVRRGHSRFLHLQNQE